jgi:tRNA-Thr(GGU) m(6)t(6)A37 methyltransferase TsaA
MKRIWFGLSISCLVGLVGCGEVTRTSDSGRALVDRQEFRVYPIGRVARDSGRTLIVIDKRYEPGLLGLDKHSYVHVVWWFDKNDTPAKRSILQVNPQGDRNNPLTGVFATHSPFRPNLIAITRCDIVSIKDNVIEVKEIDAFDGTPVLDLKGDFFRFHRPPNGGTPGE